MAAVLGPYLFLASAVHGDTVTLKTGAVYKGMVDKDGTLVQIYDNEGLKRVVLRDSKVASIVSDSPPKQERFQLVQMTIHAGEMPPFAIAIKSTPWDEFGRRKFSYIGTKSGKPLEMTQAINELGPQSVRFRGVDGFWVAKLATSQVPKEVVLGLLAKVDQKNQGERLRVGRFLIQAGWYPEALAELDRLGRDFPELRETVGTVKNLVRDSQARERLAAIELSRKAQQPKAVLAGLRTFPEEGAPADLLVTVRDQLRAAQSQADDDRALAEAVQHAADDLPAEARKAAESRILEILRALTEAPDAVRQRLEPFRKADTARSPAERFALVETGWIVGAEHAVPDPATGEALWKAREAVQDYLSSSNEASRLSALETLKQLEILEQEGGVPSKLSLAMLSTIVRLMRPSLHDEHTIAPGQTRLVRVHDDPNPNQPTEYAVLLPPEYHPLRSYPAVVALHGDEGPMEAVTWWAKEAQRRGFIVIAPEYNLRDQKRDYRYTPSEHAAVELALRDAKRRFAIDSDRVFLGGQLFGGNMAWDFGLAHPDLFAGVAIISGLPAKYVWSNKLNAPLVPLYIAMGDLAPAENDVIFEQLSKPMIIRNYDITYVKYFRRGLEDLPEEAPEVFEWMSTRRRDPAPKTFEVNTSRTSDDRFFGVVVHEFATRRAMDPEAVDPLGKNLRPAHIDFRANAVLNKLVISSAGLMKLDVWVSPELIDFSKKLEVQVNGRTYFKGMAKVDYEPMLEDLRIRGDRSQLYWLRVQAVLGRGR